MMIIITTIHVLACLVLVLSVLLQSGKGADMGAVFGGASTTIFGSSGAGNFLTRITTGAAIVFMFTSLVLTYAPRRAMTSTVMPESVPLPAAQGEPPAGDVGDEGAAGDVGEAAPADAGNPDSAGEPQAADDGGAAAPGRAADANAGAPAGAAPVNPHTDGGGAGSQPAAP